MSQPLSSYPHPGSHRPNPSCSLHRAESQPAAADVMLSWQKQSPAGTKPLANDPSPQGPARRLWYPATSVGKARPGAIKRTYSAASQALLGTDAGRVLLSHRKPGLAGCVPGTALYPGLDLWRGLCGAGAVHRPQRANGAESQANAPKGRSGSLPPGSVSLLRGFQCSGNLELGLRRGIGGP